MKRLLSDFNANIRKELDESIDLKANKNRIEALTKLRDANYKQYRDFANQQGSLTRQINKFKEANPFYADSLEESRQQIQAAKDGFRVLYEQRKTDLNKLTGQDFTLNIALHKFANSSRAANRGPLLISKEKLLAKPDPALYIMSEQSRRIKYELNDIKPKIAELESRFFDLDFTELAKLNKLRGAERGLRVLHQKALAAILMQKNGQSFEEVIEDNPDLLEDLAEAQETGGGGSDESPFFYIPLDSTILIY